MEAKTPKQLAELMLEHNYPGNVNDVAQAYLDLLQQDTVIEPTEEMIKAGSEELMEVISDYRNDLPFTPLQAAEDIYNAMIGVKEK